jgi:hypothetical protein
MDEFEIKKLIKEYLMDRMTLDIGIENGKITVSLYLSEDRVCFDSVYIPDGDDEYGWR